MPVGEKICAFAMLAMNGVFGCALDEPDLEVVGSDPTDRPIATSDPHWQKRFAEGDRPRVGTSR